MFFVVGKYVYVKNAMTGKLTFLSKTVCCTAFFGNFPELVIVAPPIYVKTVALIPQIYPITIYFAKDLFFLLMNSVYCPFINKCIFYLYNICM